MRPLLVLLAAYLIGSIPFGYLLVRLKVGDDVRSSGSGGTGATNVSRRAGKIAGIATLALDAAKGAAAVYVSRKLLASGADMNWWIAAAAIATIVGHIFPVWLGFRGGKGVATGVGILLSLSPLAVVGSAAIFIITVVATRYVSLGSILAVVSLPAFVWLSSAYIAPVPHRNEVIVTAVIGGALIVFMHRANISRLMHGTESKFR